MNETEHTRIRNDESSEEEKSISYVEEEEEEKSISYVEEEEEKSISYVEEEEEKSIFYVEEENCNPWRYSYYGYPSPPGGTFELVEDPDSKDGHLIQKKVDPFIEPDFVEKHLAVHESLLDEYAIEDVIELLAGADEIVGSDVLLSTIEVLASYGSEENSELGSDEEVSEEELSESSSEESDRPYLYELQFPDDPSIEYFMELNRIEEIEEETTEKVEEDVEERFEGSEIQMDDAVAYYEDKLMDSEYEVEIVTSEAVTIENQFEDLMAKFHHFEIDDRLRRLNSHLFGVEVEPLTEEQRMMYEEAKDKTQVAETFRGLEDYMDQVLENKAGVSNLVVLDSELTVSFGEDVWSTVVIPYSKGDCSDEPIFTSSPK